LIRASINLRNKLVSKKMDHRVKPGDDSWCAAASAPSAQDRPAMAGHDEISQLT
jgi:hypothetical protein